MTDMADSDAMSEPVTLKESLEALQLGTFTCLYCVAEILHLTPSIAARTPAKQRVRKIEVDTICNHAFQFGLDSSSFDVLLDIVTCRNYLDQTTTTTLIKNLFPARLVTSKHVLSVVGSFGQGQGKPSPSTQLALVKWLHMIYDFAEDPSVFSQLYGVLFNLLDMITLRYGPSVHNALFRVLLTEGRTPLCHLLGAVTRRKHVKAFRIQQLQVKMHADLAGAFSN